MEHNQLIPTLSYMQYKSMHFPLNVLLNVANGINFKANISFPLEYVKCNGLFSKNVVADHLRAIVLNTIYL